MPLIPKDHPPITIKGGVADVPCPEPGCGCWHTRTSSLDGVERCNDCHRPTHQ